jgi:hypothetical protein
MEHPSFLERAMGIDQIRMNQAKALPRVPQFNWSQMESSYAKSHDSPIVGAKIGKPGMVRIDVLLSQTSSEQTPWFPHPHRADKPHRRASQSA